jgi:hypothetical protein
MYLLSFTTGGVKIAQQENDGHCAGKRFFPMLRFSMHKQRKKSIFFFFYFFFFLLLFFQGGNFLSSYLTNQKNPKYYHIFKKGKEMFIYYVFPANNIRHKERKKTRNQVAYSSTLFSLVYLHSTRGFGWIIMN